MLKFENKLVIAIIGSRIFTDFNKFCEVVDRFIEFYREQYSDIEIISGGAKGTDSMAKEYASIRNIKFAEFKAKWGEHGKLAAGFIRNSQMVDKCDYMIAFWNGVSSGTQDSIRKASKKKKLLHLELIKT